MHSAIAVANRILKMAHDRGNTLTPIQVMKLVFLCHGWMLGLHKKHLIEDPIEAWKYGPVIKKLYSAIKKYRSNPVPYPLKNAENTFDVDEENIITQVYDAYGSFTGMQLSMLTHEAGSPWDITWKNNREDLTISNDLIMHYYHCLAANNNPA